MNVAVIGASQTKFGELWDKSLIDLLAESELAAIRDANIEPFQIDIIFTGNMCAGPLLGQLNLSSIASEILGLSVPSNSTEGSCASGALALRAGIMAIESGMANIVLVNGVEKMTDEATEQVTTALMGAASTEQELFCGATFPALNALIARAYMHKFNLTREQLAMVSVKNHYNGSLNPLAHLQRKISIDQVINAPMVAAPLTLLDCAPISDGAASLVLCNQKIAKQCNKEMVSIIGSGQASGPLSLHNRDTLYSLKTTTIAAQQAYKQAGIIPQDIHVAEIHNAFSILEIITLEDLGICEQGTAGKITEEGWTALDGKIPISPSGGLKANGHPVGATGVFQVVEIYNQLLGRCNNRQVKNAKIGLTHAMGGIGATIAVNIFKKN